MAGQTRVGAKISSSAEVNPRLTDVCEDWPSCKDPQPTPDIPRVTEIAKKFGLEILPPPGA